MAFVSDRERLVKYWTEENIVQREKGYFDYTTRTMFDRYLSNLKEKKVLDVGCGTGLSMEYFRDKGAIVSGIDITLSSVEYANSKGLTSIEADARNLPFKDNSFDIVYSIGVIEHFKETEMALREQVRACRPGGIVVAVVPNLLTPYCGATILFEYLSGRAKHGILTTYGRPFTGKKLKNMFIEAGCGDVKVHPYYGSAFLRLVCSKVHTEITDTIERSFISRSLGLVLWGIGHKI